MGSYVLLEEIGRGGQGVVYRALHRETNEVLAVKTVLPQDAGSSETLIRFQREAAAAHGLNHPHTMSVREIGCSADGLPFFSMKLALGGSLYQLGAKYRGRWHKIAELLIKIASAVHHAHGQGILHRDLKPGNILFTDDQEPLVTDFGLAKHLTGSTNLTQSSTVLGTPNYVSPEQAAGKTKDLAPTSDIYSLGAILFELLTGRPPFVGDNALDVLRQAASEAPIRPRSLVPSIPRALETICMRCLEHRPEDRYDSAEDLADDLRGWLIGRKIASRPLYIQIWRNIKSRLTVGAWRYGTAGLVLALCIAWAFFCNRTKHAADGLTTIAVTIDGLDQNRFSNLIAQQATSELKQTLSRTSAFRLPDERPANSQSALPVFDPLAYGRALNTQVVLTGCVRSVGGKVRLVTRLFQSDTGKVVWRHVDDFPLNMASAALTKAAATIVGDLQTEWNANPQGFLGESPYAPMPEAQSLYTRAMELTAQSNPRDLQAAVLLLRQALKIDPKFTVSRAMLAYALWVQADGYGELDKIPLANSAAHEVLAEDPNSAQAHRVIACSYFKDARYSEALEEFWRAVELDPQSAGCCQSLGKCLREMGHPEQAITWFERAVRLEPAHGLTSATLAETLSLCEQDERAEAAFQHAAELEGEQPELQIGISILRVWQHRFDDARKLCTQTRVRFPDTRFGLSLAAWIELCDGNAPAATIHYEKLRAENSYQQNWVFRGSINPASALAFLARQVGSNERARQLAEEALNEDRALLAKYPHNARLLHDIAATCSVMGDTERAFSYLKEAIDAGWVEYRSTEIDPRFAALATLPRFTEMLVRKAPIAQ